mmetsp:Transcript_2570/g.2849  ORF Transcript_2570/g.2849 Transcript_2570/m.2849 type:complete len:395 (-) Transcript_2570:145-1329(-)
MPIHAGLTLWCTCTALAAISCVKSKSTATTKNTKTTDDEHNITERNKYINMKFLTWAIDYIYMGGMLYFLNTFLSGDNFTARNILLHQAANSILVCMVDLLKAISFYKLIAKAKTDHLIMLKKNLVQAFSTKAGIKGNFQFLYRVLMGEGTLTEFRGKKTQLFSIRHQIFYFIKIGLISIPLACFLQVKIGMMYWKPLTDSVMVIGVGEWYELHISQLMVVYLEYLVISFLKDGIAMNILHQLFHTIWWSHHETHHLPEKELSVFNAFYFDVPDLIGENLIGPLLFCSIKLLFGGSSCSIHYASFFLSVVCDQTVHSLNPYTITFWNPLLDNFLRPNLSHNLHHSSKVGHYTIWPLHQIQGVSGPNNKGKARDTFSFDIDDYNKTFDTHFPRDL